METKHVPSTLFFCVEDYLDACDCGEFAARAVGPLYEAAEAAGLDVTGPLQFISPEWAEEGEKGRRIFALPVSAERPAPEPWFFWTSPAFDCISKERTGSFDTQGNAWVEFTNEVLATGLKRSGGWREVYLYVENPESPDNITELQLGVE